MMLSAQEKILDEHKFVASHLARVDMGGYKGIVEPYVNRLITYYKIKGISYCGKCLREVCECDTINKEK